MTKNINCLVRRTKMKSLVLVSGGLDSTVLLHYVKAKYSRSIDEVIALSIQYGQKHEVEGKCAEWQCDKLDVPLYKANLSEAFKFNVNSSSLLAGSELEIPEGSYAEQGDHNTAYVPYRNGLFLSFAASVALQLGCEGIYYGAHLDDEVGSAYPDCTYEFVYAQEDAIVRGTGGEVILITPWVTMGMNKTDIVKMGLRCGMEPIDFAHTWSCYEGKDVPCGKCGTCIDRNVAMRNNGLIDTVITWDRDEQ